MPPDERSRIHNHQRVAPVEELRAPDHRQPKRGRCPAWPGLAFPEQGELFPEEQILGHQGDTRAKEKSDEYRQLRILQELVRLSSDPIEFLRTTGRGDSRLRLRGRGCRLFRECRQGGKRERRGRADAQNADLCSGMLDTR